MVRKTFSEAEKLFLVVWSQWQCSLSLVEKKLFSLQKVFSHTFRHIAVAPQHLAEG